MSKSWYGGDGVDRKPTLQLDGRKIIVESIPVYDGSIPTMYRRETIYHFKTEEQAMEFYYKKK